MNAAQTLLASWAPPRNGALDLARAMRKLLRDKPADMRGLTVRRGRVDVCGKRVKLSGGKGLR